MITFLFYPVHVICCKHFYIFKAYFFTTVYMQQMIWEVDENLDDMIDLDELQLTYYRNINDTSGNEPCLFFKLLEVPLMHSNILLVLCFLMSTFPCILLCSF